MKPDIIAAVATAPGRSGIGVVRVSGPDLAALAQGLVGRDLEARRATLRDFLGDERRSHRSGYRALFPRAAFVHGRGCPRAARPRGTRGAAAALEPLHRAGRTRGRARRIHAAGVPQRQARSCPGGGRRRPHRGQHHGGGALCRCARSRASSRSVLRRSLAGTDRPARARRSNAGFSGGGDRLRQAGGHRSGA